MDTFERIAAAGLTIVIAGLTLVLFTLAAPAEPSQCTTMCNPDHTWCTTHCD